MIEEFLKPGIVRGNIENSLIFIKAMFFLVITEFFHKMQAKGIFYERNKKLAFENLHGTLEKAVEHMVMHLKQVT